MTKQTVRIKGGGDDVFAVHYTGNMCIVCQFGFWYDGTVRVQAIPAGAFGLVCVTRGVYDYCSDAGIVGAWLVFSPAAIEFELPLASKRKFYRCSKSEMQSWYRACGGWKHVKSR